MKNLKKLSRNELKKLTGGGGATELFLEAGGCGASTWCACGSAWIDMGNGPREECCACPKQGF